MENLIEVKNDNNSLDKLYNTLKKDQTYECSKTYDIWEHRTDASGHMVQCVVLKKNAMHAVKLYFIEANILKINHIIPNKIMSAYFGKSVKARRNIIEIIAGFITQSLLSGSQQKAFDEMELVVKNMAI